MQRYLLLALTLFVVFLASLAQGSATKSSITLQEEELSNRDFVTTNAGPTNTLTATATFTPILTATATITPTLAATATLTPTLAATATLTPTLAATATLTPSLTATATVTSIASYPNSPWLLQNGELVYNSSSNNHWIEGNISWPNGDPIEDFYLQLCLSDGSQCSGPSTASSATGQYEWLNFNGDGSNGNGEYYAVVVDCSGVSGNPDDYTIGNWDACEEHSEHVDFTINMPDQSVATINWVLVDPPKGTPLATSTPTSTPTATPDPNVYLPLALLMPSPTPTNTPTPSNTPTNTPTATPSNTPTPSYPNKPWFLQDGGVSYDYNPDNHWLEGKVRKQNGNGIGDMQIQICNSNGTKCTGPSHRSDASSGKYDWVNFTDRNDFGGDYYAVVVSCEGVNGNPFDSTLGEWPACEEWSERAEFELDGGRVIAKINWVLVHPID